MLKVKYKKLGIIKRTTMADGRTPAPPVPPVPRAPLVVSPVPDVVEPSIPSGDAGAPAASEAGSVLFLKWSHFVPEFSDQLEKDTESHLLRTNGVAVQSFCITLLSKA